MVEKCMENENNKNFSFTDKLFDRIFIMSRIHTTNVYLKWILLTTYFTKLPIFFPSFSPAICFLIYTLRFLGDEYHAWIHISYLWISYDNKWNNNNKNGMMNIWSLSVSVTPCVFVCALSKSREQTQNFSPMLFHRNHTQHTLVHLMASSTYLRLVHHFRINTFQLE